MTMVLKTTRRGTDRLRRSARRLLACVLLIGAVRGQPAAAQAANRPNIVLIITDDMGYGDLGSYGATDIRTPNLDRLAREGVRFTDFYANGTTCTPTRAGLMSGRYQQRYLVEAPLPAGSGVAGEMAERGLDASPYSLPRLLKNGGYATALVGKWHLGYQPNQSPNAHGFDWFFGLKSGYHDYWRHHDSRGQPDLWENDARVTVEGYTTDLITTKAIEFIEQNATRPFFVDVAYNAPHWPFQRPDTPTVAVGNARFLKPADSVTSSRADYVAMVERMDRGVGAILATLERKGLTRNTIVIFTNDNGGEWLSNNAPLFNRKWTTWEGGIRVPAIMRWPGRIPAGTVTPQVGVTMDLTASVLAAAKVRVPTGARPDGINLLPILERMAPVASRTLFWRSTQENRVMHAVREGDMKIVVDGSHLYLYDVRKDPGERKDLARLRTDVARRLRLKLTAWEKDVNAEAALLR